MSYNISHNQRTGKATVFKGGIGGLFSEKVKEFPSYAAAQKFIASKKKKKPKTL
jgi:hypothetical protein